MAKSSIKLKVASPCSASWEDMEGDDAIRHCGACDQKVYQLSNMASEEVETFLLSRRSRGLRTCVRFYQRADGTMLTGDCSVGKARKRKKRVMSAVGAMAVSASAVGIGMRAQANPQAASAAVSSPAIVEPVIVEPVIVEPVIVEPAIIEPAVTPPPPPAVIEVLGQEIMGEMIAPPPHELVQGGLMEPALEMLGDVEYIPPSKGKPFKGK